MSSNEALTLIATLFFAKTFTDPSGILFNFINEIIEHRPVEAARSIMSSSSAMGFMHIARENANRIDPERLILYGELAGVGRLWIEGLT